MDEPHLAIWHYLTDRAEALARKKAAAGPTSSASASQHGRSGDIIETCCWTLRTRRSKAQFGGRREITELHARLVDNLRLGMSVFLNGTVRDAQAAGERAAFATSNAVRTAPGPPVGQHGYRASKPARFIGLISDYQASLASARSLPILDSTPVHWHEPVAAKRTDRRRSAHIGGRRRQFSRGSRWARSAEQGSSAR